MATSVLSYVNCPRESGQLSTIIPHNHGINITYRLALPLLSPETLSSLSKLRIFLFNVHFALFVRRMINYGRSILSVSIYSSIHTYAYRHNINENDQIREKSKDIKNHE